MSMLIKKNKLKYKNSKISLKNIENFTSKETIHYLNNFGCLILCLCLSNFLIIQSELTAIKRVKYSLSFNKKDIIRFITLVNNKIVI